MLRNPLYPCTAISLQTPLLAGGSSRGTGGTCGSHPGLRIRVSPHPFGVRPERKLRAHVYVMCSLPRTATGLPIQGAGGEAPGAWDWSRRECQKTCMIPDARPRTAEPLNAEHIREALQESLGPPSVKGHEVTYQCIMTGWELVCPVWLLLPTVINLLPCCVAFWAEL